MKTYAIDFNLDIFPDDHKILKALMRKIMQRMNWLEEQFCLALDKRFGANGEPIRGKMSCLMNQRIFIRNRMLNLSLRLRSSPINVNRLNASHYLPSCRVVHDIDEANKIC